MKKIIMTVVLALMAVSASAQWYYTKPHFYGCDTLFPPDRDPVYYYWDTVWYDKYIGLPNTDWSNGRWGTSQRVKPEYARYCYTDSALRVIGIAAALYIFEYRKVGDTTDPWAGTVPE